MNSRSWEYFLVLTLTLTLTLTLKVSCQTTKSPFEQSSKLSNEGECEKALEIFKAGSDETTGYQIKKVGGTVSSYAVTGAGYAVDIVATVTTGVVAFGVICGPAILLSVAMSGASTSCWDPTGSSGSLILNPKLGEKAHKSTESWRLNSDEMSQSLRNLSGCYEQRGGEDNLIKAYVQLEQVEKGVIFEDASDDEKFRLKTSKIRVENKLKKIDSPYLKKLKKHSEIVEKKLDAESLRIMEAIHSDRSKYLRWLQFEQGMHWRLYSARISSGNLAEVLCGKIKSENTSKWRQPNRKEVAKAVEDGIFKTEKLVKAGENLNFWIKDSAGLYYESQKEEFSKNSPAKPSEVQLMCIQ